MHSKRLSDASRDRLRTPDFSCEYDTTSGVHLGPNYQRYDTEGVTLKVYTTRLGRLGRSVTCVDETSTILFFPEEGEDSDPSSSPRRVSGSSPSRRERNNPVVGPVDRCNQVDRLKRMKLGHLQHRNLHLGSRSGKLRLKSRSGSPHHLVRGSETVGTSLTVTPVWSQIPRTRV